MKRFLGYAAVLGLVQFVVASAVAIVLFRDVDLRFHVLLQFLLIPFVQSAVLCAARPDPTRAGIVEMLVAVARDRLLGAILMIDVALFATLTLGGLFDRLGGFLNALRLALAAAALIYATAHGPWTRNDRARVVALAAGLALTASAFVTGWLAALPERLPLSSKIVAWMAAYVPLFTLLVIVALLAIPAIERYWRVAGRLIDTSVLLAVVAAIVVVCNIFWRPFLVAPWDRVVDVLLYFSITASLLAAVGVVRSGEAR